MKNQKNITDRKQLKSLFKKGNLPDESAFEKLIDSTFNKADDKLDINDDGVMFYPSDNGKEKLLSFFEDKDDAAAMWALFVSKKSDGGIYINKIGRSEFDDISQKDTEQPPAFFIHRQAGKVGLGTNKPKHRLDVKGIVASEGRSGNYREGELDADGKWHNVFINEVLSGCNAFEIMAYAEGDAGEGKYSLMHAIAICTHGNSKPKISKTSACYGKKWNKIDIRWEFKPSGFSENSAGDKKKLFDFSKWWKRLWEHNDPYRYNLQLKTKSNYGDDKKIKYKVSILWDTNFTRAVK